MTKASFRASVWASLLAGLLLIGLSPGGAHAAGKNRVGVDVNGSPSGPIRAAVSDVLKHHGYEVASADVSGDSEDAIARVAKQGKLTAVIVGEVRDGGKRAKLRVYGAGGDLIGEGSWAEHGGAKKLAAAIERTLWARIGGALAKAKGAEGDAGEKAERPPKAAATSPNKAEKAEKTEEKAEAPEEKSAYSRSEAAESTGDADEGSSRKGKGKGSKKKKKLEDEDEGEGEGGAGAPAATALELGVGGRFISRTLTWANNAVRGYSMGFAPALGVTLAWYPAAHFRGGWPSNLGLAASAELLPGYESKTSDGTHYPTQENDYWAGARGRLPLGPVEAAFTLGGGQHAFVFRSGGAANRAALADLPDVQYTYARAAVDLRIALPSSLSIVVGGGYRYVLAGGDKNYLVEGPTFFPGAKIWGLDATGGVGYRVLPFLEGRAGVDLRRYAITTNATAMQPAVASGTDQTFAIWVQAVLVLDGAKGGAAGAARPAPAPAEDTDKGDHADPDAEKSGSKSPSKSEDE
jgi:hypothetical protein